MGWVRVGRRSLCTKADGRLGPAAAVSGGGGIRTREGMDTLSVFKTDAIGRSATPPIKIGKSVYWFTKTGGEIYFGNIEEVPHTEAQRLLHHPNNLSDAPQDRKNGFAARKSMSDGLDWMQKKHSESNDKHRRTHLTGPPPPRGRRR